jgi:2'-5' RNA ligase
VSAEAPVERARLFVALELPDAVVSAVLSWRAAALASVPGLRLLPEGSLHVTLCFLGSVAVTEVAPIGDACAARAVAAPDLSLGELVWLPPRRPQVAAVRVEDPSGALVSLQAAIASALAAGGWYEPEARPYLPHVTVARVGRRQRVRPPGSVAPPPATAFRGSSVILFRSRPGSLYEPLRAVPMVLRTADNNSARSLIGDDLVHDNDDPN